MTRIWLLLASVLLCVLYSKTGQDSLVTEAPILIEYQYYDGGSELATVCQNGKVLLRTGHQSRFEKPSTLKDAELLLGPPLSGESDCRYWRMSVFKAFDKEPYSYVKLCFDRDGRLVRIEPLRNLADAKAQIEF